jgi:hypothetical protein
VTILEERASQNGDLSPQKWQPTAKRGTISRWKTHCKGRRRSSRSESSRRALKTGILKAFATSRAMHALNRKLFDHTHKMRAILEAGASNAMNVEPPANGSIRIVYRVTHKLRLFGSSSLLPCKMLNKHCQRYFRRLPCHDGDLFV